MGKEALHHVKDSLLIALKKIFDEIDRQPFLFHLKFNFRFVKD